MEPISRSDFTFAIIGSWEDIIFALFIIYFGFKLFKSISRVLPGRYLLLIIVALVSLLRIIQKTNS